MRHHCCFIPCDQDAEYQIWKDDTVVTPDDYTEACESHVGALLFEGRSRVSPIGWEP